MKRRITFVGRVENDVEHHKPRARPEQPIEQQRPDFPRPRIWPLRHELERAITRDFFRGQRRQFQRALINPEKYEIARRWSLPSLCAEQIFKTLFPAPRHRNKWRAGKEMAKQN